MTSARLSMLKKSLADMSLEELREHVRGVRADRKVSKEKKKEKKTRQAKVAKTSAGVMKMIAKMSPEEAEALLRELEGNDYDSEGSTDQGDQGQGPST